MSSPFILLQVANTVDLTLDVLLIVLVVLFIIVIAIVGITALTVYIKVNRTVSNIEKLISDITQIPHELRMAGLFGGLGSSIYGFMSGFKDRTRGNKNDDQ